MRIIKARGLLKLIYLFAGIVQIAAIFSAFEKPAYAYVDPGLRLPVASDCRKHARRSCILRSSST